jgi:hypothetical protein
MYCRVVELWENGHLLPNHRLKASNKWYVGEFSLEPCQHEAFHRTMRRAKLIHTIEEGGQGEAVLPYLQDACMVIAQEDWMRVSGFYYDDHSKHSVAQTWHVIFLAKDYRDWVAIDSAEKARKYDEEMKRKSEAKK